MRLQKLVFYAYLISYYLSYGSKVLTVLYRSFNNIPVWNPPDFEKFEQEPKSTDIKDIKKEPVQDVESVDLGSGQA